MPIVAQQTDAADLLGVTPRTLRDWMRIPGFPDCASGYHIEAIRQWQESNARKGSEPEDAMRKLKLALQAEKLKQAQIETRDAQLRLEAKEKTLLPRQAVERSAAVILSGLVDTCEQLPDLVAAIVSKQEQAKVREFIKRELTELRMRIAADLRALPGESPR